MRNYNVEIGLFARIALFFLNPARFKILQKGRQVGATKNAVNHILQKCLTSRGNYILWVDVSYKTIRTYFDKYWYPVLKKLPKDLWIYNKSYYVLKINHNTVIFKSAENPESIEGDNYTEIYVNECGFILKDGKLLEESLLPMLMATGGSATLFGTPKSSKNSYHYDLIQKVKEGKKKHWHYDHLTTYDNPYIPLKWIKQHIETADDLSVLTEIYGEFRDNSIKDFFYAFRREKHVKEVLNTGQIHISFDFNVNPMTAIVGYPIKNGVVIFDEFYMENADIYDICKAIRISLNGLRVHRVTGDASGKNRNQGLKGLRNLYSVIIQELGISPQQVQIGRKNPSIINSRVHCNSVLSKGSVTIDPHCKHLLEDLTRMQMTDREEIDKTNPRLTHVGDCFRYFINAFLPNFVQEIAREPITKL